MEVALDCRVCRSVCFNEVLLTYNNMPSSAQGFPEFKDLKNDIGSSLSVLECSSCGLIQLNNPPVSYYKEVIRAVAFSEEMCEFREVQFKAWINKNGLLNKSVLEIGCGKGEYLSILNKSGVFAHGVEFSEQSVMACRELGLSVTQGYFGDYDFILPYPKYAGFTCLNFMEHWPDPNKALAHLKECLVDGGIGLIEVPNFDMILKKGLFSEFISDHLLYFTQETLIYMMQHNGFEVLECSSVWHDYIISIVVRKRVKTDLKFFDEYRLRVESELNSFIDKFSSGRVAIWGAGHQALAVISLAGISMKIKYVIDSALFKQGKYTPASHVPIVAPEELNLDPVDAVIIMAASYSDEVARIVREKYSSRIQVAILRDHGLERIKN